MLTFRNLVTTPDDPVDKWGTEGILTAFERGTLADMHPILTAVQADPYGEVADWVLETATISTSPLTQLVARRVQEARDPRLKVARQCREAIILSGFSLRQAAAILGTSPAMLTAYTHGQRIPSATRFHAIQHLQNTTPAEKAVL